MMATCKECIHNSVCEEVNNLKCRKDFIWYRAESGCPYYKPTAEVAPKSEVVREIIDEIEMYVLGIKSGKEIIEKTTPKIYRLKRKDYMEAVLEHIAIVKKKHTEEKENENL